MPAAFFQLWIVSVPRVSHQLPRVGPRRENKGGQTKQRKREKRRSMPPGKSLKSTVPELPFSAFWEVILQNSEYIKRHIKYTKDD